MGSTKTVSSFKRENIRAQPQSKAKVNLQLSNVWDPTHDLLGSSKGLGHFSSQYVLFFFLRQGLTLQGRLAVVAIPGCQLDNIWNELQSGIGRLTSDPYLEARR